MFQRQEIGLITIMIMKRGNTMNQAKIQNDLNKIMSNLTIKNINRAIELSKLVDLSSYKGNFIVEYRKDGKLHYDTYSHDANSECNLSN